MTVFNKHILSSILYEVRCQITMTGGVRLRFFSPPVEMIKNPIIARFFIIHTYSFGYCKHVDTLKICLLYPDFILYN